MLALCTWRFSSSGGFTKKWTEDQPPFFNTCIRIIIIMLPIQAIAATPSAPRPTGAEAVWVHPMGMLAAVLSSNHLTSWQLVPTIKLHEEYHNHVTHSSHSKTPSAPRPTGANCAPLVSTVRPCTVKVQKFARDVWVPVQAK
jgi:hypothetical protein